MLATTSADHTIKIWSRPNDSAAFSHSKTLTGHQRWVWDCVYSADSAYLVSGTRLQPLSSTTVARHRLTAQCTAGVGMRQRHPTTRHACGTCRKETRSATTQASTRPSRVWRCRTRKAAAVAAAYVAARVCVPLTHTGISRPPGPSHHLGLFATTSCGSLSLSLSCSLLARVLDSLPLLLGSASCTRVYSFQVYHIDLNNN